MVHGDFTFLQLFSKGLVLFDGSLRHVYEAFYSVFVFRLWLSVRTLIISVKFAVSQTTP